MSINARGGNGTTQACAACKYQRRKCAPDCILAPYFPHDRQRQFLNAHKLFGVSNITKIIRNLDQPNKDHAMTTIIFQSDARANDPVGGCYRMICELQRQIEYTVAELDIVHHQLALYKAQHHLHLTPPNATDHDHDYSTLNCDIINPDPLNSYNPLCYHQLLQPQPQPHDHDHDQYIMQYNHVPLQDISSWNMHEDKQSYVKECEDFKPPLERHDYRKFEHEETIEQSEEDILKDEKEILREENDSIQHAQDHDLKSAATLFTLTNCTG